MNKIKAIMITLAFMAIFGCVLILMWDYQVRSYYVLIQILGIYGFIMAGINLGRWLSKEDPPRKKEVKTYEDWAREEEV